MLTASFPPGKLSFLAWFSLVPLLKSLENESPSRAFRLGLITGAAHYLTLIYWIMVVLGHYGNINPFLCLIPYFLLCLYLALFPAFFSSLITLLNGSRFALILMASFWVGLEYVRAKILTGFPWCLLGYTQYKHLYLIQIADLCGVYGLSFLIVLLNGFIYRLLFRHHPKPNHALRWEILVVILVAGGTLAYGHYRLSEAQKGEKSRRQLNVAVIQGNIDQSLKWNIAYQTKTMETYQRLTLAAYDFKPELIVWPETSVPFFFQSNVEFSSEMSLLAKESGSVLIFGSPAYTRLHEMTKYYNRAYLITPDEHPPQYYDKVHLVPFGEYVPLRNYLSFIHRLVPAAGDFEAGDKIVPLNHGNFSLGILICFEAIFPELARAHAREGANILVNLTNDAWFGMTSAPYQHLSMAVFRSVENRLPMIRAANTGFSAFIGAQGKIVALSTLFEEDVLNAPVRISASPLTFYTRYGDILVFSLLAIALCKIFSSLWKKWGVHR
jgi:apolipoprotein N-acyltransferase